MRGRAVEAVVYPFCSREKLRHHSVNQKSARQTTKVERLTPGKRFSELHGVNESKYHYQAHGDIRQLRSIGRTKSNAK